ncbi:MAG: 4Fe-4S binding protein [Desulfovibrio sp.]|nr:4Fe-4S binding protein [Desulfovibrio sp.]
MTKTVLANLFKKYATRLHPFEQRVLPDGFRGRFKFAIDKCILCRMCAVRCPTQVITIDPEQGLWHREVMGCLYCGVCADVCPTGCINMTNVYRPPITEPAFLTFNVPPRPKKGKKTETSSEKEIAMALEDKITETEEKKTAVSRQVTPEERAVKPTSKAKAKAASAKSAGSAKAKTAVSKKK